jgi:hypothetical protein
LVFGGPAGSLGGSSRKGRRPGNDFISTKGAAPISGAEEQTARAISAYVQCAWLLFSQMGDKYKLD